MSARFRLSLATFALAALAAPTVAQTVDPGAAMHWRSIGPPRAGRARALSGVATQPNLFYIGFDMGGVWRSTDYGSTWTPIFDKQSTGSIGAIAVAPSNPNIIYVGSGAGIIRPDLATGDGLYKSTDAGRTWTHLGLFDSQMIAQIDVDPRNPDRFFVAVLGHPYGPNQERGVFRSTDGGKTLEKVLYKDEYTSANDVHIDPSNPQIVYAALWIQQQSYIEGGAFGGGGGGIFKSTDGGTTWKQLTNGLPEIVEANLGASTSNPNVLYAMVAATGAVNAPPPVAEGATPPGAAGRGGRGGRGGGGGPAQTIGIFRSNDGGEHWFLAVRGADGRGNAQADGRPLGRIGGGDLATLTVDPKNENVLYSCSTVFWRSEDGGITWTAVRGAPGGDDYQKSWVNPVNPDILLVVSDQGGVVSANRGQSWSNWYTQPTAAMYHVSTSTSFPYQVCSGQQDSGSACVDSRGNDGEITFHDWHPVMIQEYGEAAPDPKRPHLIYGSSRNGVSLYNQLTGQTKQVGPEIVAPYNRNVRTQPIEWSPVNPNVMFYAQNAVYRTSNGGNSWTRISGDLARQTWAVPATAAHYTAPRAADSPPGGAVTPGSQPQGTITALSPSPLDVNVLWAGTDDGNIQVMMDSTHKWTNVTPPAIKPWTRIFNIEAGHFNKLTAYAAANTLRIDDLNPHFWRTHDGGKTWTEINTGIAAGSPVNSIREDPRQPELLYGATDTQVWVSFDDGDHWQSLRNDMPAVSVRDITVKDDSTCMCADLVVGTHGRGFWILDDVTPLRQAAALRVAASNAAPYLVKPVTAVRVRFGMNSPTPWPPELPAGENPPPGAILDYFLGADASGPVKFEILNSAGKSIRTFSSADPVMSPDPATDPVAYNKICQATPNAPDCALPLYWPAPPMIISTKAGMHRIWWDMKMEPLNEGGGGRGGGGGAAVPHRTYSSANAPWAVPGSYTVRMTVDGKTYTQPIAVRLDPRVKTSAADLAQISSLTTEMYNGARAAQATAEQARAFATKLEALSGDDVAAFRARVDSLAGGGAGGSAGAGGGRGGRGGGGGGRGGRGGAADAPAPTLPGVASAMFAAAMGLQGSEMAPTSREVAACTKARSDNASVMAKWTKLTTVDLAALNVKRKAAGQAPITLDK